MTRRVRDLDAEWLGRRAMEVDCIEGGDRTTIGDLAVRLMDALAVAIPALREIVGRSDCDGEEFAAGCPGCIARRALDTAIGEGE